MSSEQILACINAACHFAGARPLSAQASASYGPHGTIDQHDGRLVAFPVFSRQMDNFVDVIRGKSTPLVHLVGGVINAFVIDALLASAKSGAREAINLPAVIRDRTHLRSERT